jgi:hypothetical protein
VSYACSPSKLLFWCNLWGRISALRSYGRDDLPGLLVILIENLNVRLIAEVFLVNGEIEVERLPPFWMIENSQHLIVSKKHMGHEQFVLFLFESASVDLAVLWTGKVGIS